MNMNQDIRQNLTSLNDQIRDSIDAVTRLTEGSSKESIAVMTYQIMAHAAGLAMLNAVSQQQHFYTLQNAMVSVAAKGALDSNSEDALKRIGEVMKSYDLLETFNGLKKFMDDLTRNCKDLSQKTEDKHPSQGVNT